MLRCKGLCLTSIQALILNAEVAYFSAIYKGNEVLMFLYIGLNLVNAAFVLAILNSVDCSFARFVMKLVFSASIAIPNLLDDWQCHYNQFLSILPPILTMSSAHRRLMTKRPLMLTVPSWFSNTSDMIPSYKALKRTSLSGTTSSSEPGTFFIGANYTAGCFI